jgi:predicted phosphoribosyltransferase
VPEAFRAVGEWYEDFDQVTDHEVCCTLDRFIEHMSGLQAA